MIRSGFAGVVGDAAFLRACAAAFLAGTFGAFIKIKSPIPTRRALFDIGVAGPLAGFVVALPVAVIGIERVEPVVAVAVGGEVAAVDMPDQNLQSSHQRTLSLNSCRSAAASTSGDPSPSPYASCASAHSARAGESSGCYVIHVGDSFTVNFAHHWSEAESDHHAFDLARLHGVERVIQEVDQGSLQRGRMTAQMRQVGRERNVEINLLGMEDRQQELSRVADEIIYIDYGERAARVHQRPAPPGHDP